MIGIICAAAAIGLFSAIMSNFLSTKMPNLNSLDLSNSLRHYIEGWSPIVEILIHITLWPIYWIVVFVEFLTRGVEK